MVEGKIIILTISGLGILFYSPQNVRHIPLGSNYLRSSYLDEAQVQSHIQRGTLVAFGTGSPGTFILQFHDGYPDEEHLRNSRFKYRLGLHCVGGVVCFRDLYDLINWNPECGALQTIELKDGFYHVTLCSELPPSGRIGDNQNIEVYLKELKKLPALSPFGIPMLCS